MAYFVIFCNFLIYAEDPVSHSRANCTIPVIGNDYAFVTYRYCTESTFFSPLQVKNQSTLSLQNIFAKNIYIAMNKLESIFVFIVVSRLLCLTRYIFFFSSNEEEFLT